MYHVDEESSQKWRAISGTKAQQFPQKRGVCDIESADEEGSAEEDGQAPSLASRITPDEPLVKQVRPPVEDPRYSVYQLVMLHNYAIPTAKHRATDEEENTLLVNCRSTINRDSD